MVLDTVILSVNPKQVTRKRDNQLITIWEATIQDGTVWSTPRADVGNQAIASIGVPSSLGVKMEVQPNSNFPKRYLQSVTPKAGGVVGAQVAHAQAAQAGQAAPIPVTQATYPPTTPTPAAPQPIDVQAELAKLEDQQAAASRAKDQDIHRQVALKVAAWLNPANPAEFWENVDKLEHYMNTGEKPTDSDIPF